MAIQAIGPKTVTAGFGCSLGSNASHDDSIAESGICGNVLLYKKTVPLSLPVIFTSYFKYF